MKATFPMTAAEVRAVLTVLATAAPPLARAEYTLEQLADEVLRPHAELLGLRVHKRREHHAFAGCKAELTTLAAAGSSVLTIAVESEDPERVRAAVRELGLDALPVVCVARGLKTLAGLGTHRYAAIDIGTNSVKLHVGDRAADGSWRDVDDRAEVTRLGEGVDRMGWLGETAIARTVAAVAALADEARKRGAEAIVAAGTAGLRTAANGQELVDAVHERSGLAVEILSGEEEARLAYVAAVAALPPVTGSRLVFDSGGGSSQFTFGHGDGVDERFSLDVGAVRIAERHGLEGVVAPERLTAALAGIASDLSRLRGRPPPDAIAGMGGTVTNLAAVRHGLVAYDPAVIQGTTLSLAEIDRQIELYRSHTAEQRRAIAGLQPGRAEVILAGACIVRTVLEELGHSSLTVSDRGLRHGLIAARFGPSHEPVATSIPKEELV
jgi:exopolyphosphatase/guanosine-5'-triphosphate,3'-diphosphate pyrophosphatase